MAHCQMFFVSLGRPVQVCQPGACGAQESAISLGRILRTIDSRSSPSVGGVDGRVSVVYPLAFGLSGSITLNFKTL